MALSDSEPSIPAAGLAAEATADGTKIASGLQARIRCGRTPAPSIITLQLGTTTTTRSAVSHFQLLPYQVENPGEGQTSSLKVLDMAQHHLLIFSQKTNGQPFIRIDTDTSMANYEGEPTKANIITLSNNMIDTDYTLTLFSICQCCPSGPRADQPHVHLSTANGASTLCSH